MNPATKMTAPESPVPSPEPLTCNLQPAAPFAYRGNGKVARLPRPLRDQINLWLLDGLSYPDIIQRLGELGKDLKPAHLSEWKKRGHQDWLLEQAWLAQTRARQEPASALSADFTATQVSHAALQLGALHIFEALRDLNSESPRREECLQADDSPLPEPKIKNQKPARSALDVMLGGDSAAFVRLMNALARASRETMLVQKYHDACAQAPSALQESRDPGRKLNESETRAIVTKVDEILGLSSEVGTEGETEESNVQDPMSQFGEQVEPVHCPESVLTAEEGNERPQLLARPDDKQTT